MKWINFLKHFRNFNFDAAVGASVMVCSIVVLSDAYQEGRYPLLGTAPCKEASYRACNGVITADHIKILEDEGLLIVDDVLTCKELADIALDINALTLSAFQASPNKSEEIRTDKILFLKKTDRDFVINKRDPSITDKTPGDGEGLLHAQLLLRGIGQTLIEQNFTGFSGSSLKDTESKSSLFVPDQVQLSIYSGLTRGFYRAHRDGVSESFLDLGLLQWLKLYCYRARVLTAILYLNSDDINLEESDGSNLHKLKGSWSKDRDGGCLRVFLGAHSSDTDGSTAACFQDIEPRGGRLVIFDSQKVLHEVLSTNRTRAALTCWFTK